MQHVSVSFQSCTALIGSNVRLTKNTFKKKSENRLIGFGVHQQYDMRKT